MGRPAPVLKVVLAEAPRAGAGAPSESTGTEELRPTAWSAFEPVADGGLVLCEGATLRLLHTLHPAPPPATALRCIVFGSPAIGNAALADHVHRLGWEAHFRSIVLPGGGLPLLLPCRCRCPTTQHPLAVMNVSCCMCLA